MQKLRNVILASKSHFYDCRVTRARGSTMVEMAIVINLFLILVFGIFEFALMIYKVSMIVEGTRAGARYVVVNDIVANDPAPDCPGGGALEVSGVVGNASYDELVNVIDRYVTIPDLANKVTVKYECSSTGFSDSYRDMYTVTTSIKNITYKPMFYGLLGIDAEFDLPDYATTLLSEDLHTP